MFKLWSLNKFQLGNSWPFIFEGLLSLSRFASGFRIDISVDSGLENQKGLVLGHRKQCWPPKFWFLLLLFFFTEGRMKKEEMQGFWTNNAFLWSRMYDWFSVTQKCCWRRHGGWEWLSVPHTIISGRTTWVTSYNTREPPSLHSALLDNVMEQNQWPQLCPNHLFFLDLPKLSLKKKAKGSYTRHSHLRDIVKGRESRCANGFHSTS